MWIFEFEVTLRAIIISLFTLVLLFGAQQAAWAHDGDEHRFVKNEGQWPEGYLFRLNLNNGQFFFFEDKMVAHLWNGEQYSEFLEALHHNQTPPSNISQHVYEVKFNASTTSLVDGEKAATYYFNYYLGDDSNKWKTNVQSFESILYRNVWPGIDLRYYLQGQSLKYDFIVHPGAEWSKIALEYQYLNGLKIKSNELVLKTGLGEIKESKPYSYQKMGGTTHEVKVDYQLKNNRLTFKPKSAINPNVDFIIDPQIIFSTYSGSTGDNWGTTACNDQLGNAFGAGINFQTGYPISTGAFQSTFGGNCDASISKFNQNGTGLLYSTYIGGQRAEIPLSIICDAQNNLVVMGITGSSNYPTTAGAYDVSFNGGPNFGLWASGGFGSPFLANFPDGVDLFLAKFNANGTQLLASTLMGGSGNDGINTSATLNKNYGDQFRGEVNIDPAGNIYGVSSTYSTDFPVTNAWQNSNGGNQDACIFKFNPLLNQLAFSSYYGGPLSDAGYGINIAASGNLYVCGGTQNNNLAGMNGLSTSHLGDADGFVIQLAGNGSTLIGGTYLGTSAYDQTYFIQLDLAGNVYAMGQTFGSYPINANGNNPFYSVNNGSIFIHKLNSALNTSLWSTRIGNNVVNNLLSPSAFLVDDCNYISLSLWGGSVNQANTAGFSSTTGLPTTPGAFQTNTDGSDFYLCVLKDNASGLDYGSFFGGNFVDEHVDGGTSRFDKSGAIYQAVCAGCGGSSNMPTTPGAWSSSNNSQNCNLGVFKFDLSSFSAIANASTNVICNGQSVSFNNLSTNSNQFIWNFGDGTTSTLQNPTHTFNTLGNYQVMLIAFGQGPCANTDTAFIPIDVVGAPIVDFLPIPPICPNDTVQINASGAVLYNWISAPGILPGSANLPNPFVSPLVTSTYTLIASNNCGVDTVTFTIQVIPFDLSVQLSAPEICVGQSVTLSATGAASYNWTPAGLFANAAASSHTLSPIVTTTYYLTATNAANCVKNDSARVVVSVLPIAQVVDDTTICYQSNLTLNGTGGTSNYWFNPLSASVQQINPYVFSADTTTRWIFVAQNACGIDYDTILVKVSRVYPTAGPDTTVCLEKPIQVFATGGVNYTWQPAWLFSNPNQANTVFSTAFPQQISVVVQDTVGCSEKVNLNINFFPKSTVNAGPDQIISFGDEVRLAGTASPGNYMWIPFKNLSCAVCLTTSAQLFESTWFTLFLTDQYGCQFKDSAFVMIEGSIYIPNSFTPNENGTNETFNVNGVDIKSYTLRIFNRWGQQVFQTSDMTKGWTGFTDNKKEIITEVFVYQLEYTLNSGRKGEKKGTVTLVR